MRNYEQELFDQLYAIENRVGSPLHVENYSIYRTNFELKKKDNLEEITYRVFLKAGIQFEITKQQDTEDNSTDYIFHSLLEGPLNCETAQSILAVFIILGIDVEINGSKRT